MPSFFLDYVYQKLFPNDERYRNMAAWQKEIMIMQEVKNKNLGKYINIPKNLITNKNLIKKPTKK